MKQRRGNLGFTMMEMIIVIAILVIVFALAFVAVSQYQRTMYQKQLDGTAKELYMAAQNHLSVANSQGLLEPTQFISKDDKHGYPKAWEGDEDGFYYYATPADRGYLTDAREAQRDLPLMLPYGSIDDTVRLSGSYVIRYQYDASKDLAVVWDVFYAEENAGFLFTQFGHSFDAANSTECGNLKNYSGDDKADQRLHYSTNDRVIGWYAGENGGGLNKVDGLDSLKLEVKNAERLTAEITTPDNAAFEKFGFALKDGTADNEITLELQVRGSTSQAIKYFPVAKYTATSKLQLNTDAEANDFKKFVTVSSADSKITFNLDDITVEGGHFADIFGDAFIPGEDLVMQVFAYGKDSDGIPKIASSNIRMENSLFHSIVEAPDKPESEVAEGETITTHRAALVANMRHLENLYGTISGYNPTGASETLSESVQNAWKGDKGFAATSAQQIADLDWGDFLTVVKTGTTDSKVYTKGPNAQSTAAGFFMPVNPEYDFNYDGLSHKVSRVWVNENSNAGLFGAAKNETEENGTIKNLELVSFNVASSGGNAGALAGTLTGIKVSGVLVRNEGNESITIGGAETKLKVSAGGDAGGLVGSISGGSINKCAAAVYVESAGGSAGGLVGNASGTPITNSYSGGHTQDGKYVEDSCNVKGSGDAGGLVGTTNALISYCYSTCSAKGATVGGLVGSSTASPAAITNCYALGKVFGVNDESSKGAFAGSVQGSLTGNRYLNIVNNSASTSAPDDAGTFVGPIGGNSETVEGVSAIDATTDSFNAFALLSAPANPYDATLMQNYVVSEGGVRSVRYMYQTIKQLNSSAFPEATVSTDLDIHMQMHYGDWPSPETLVINE